MLSMLAALILISPSGPLPSPGPAALLFAAAPALHAAAPARPPADEDEDEAPPSGGPPHASFPPMTGGTDPATGTSRCVFPLKYVEAIEARGVAVEEIPEEMRRIVEDNWNIGDPPTKDVLLHVYLTSHPKAGPGLVLATKDCVIAVLPAVPALIKELFNSGI
jgi:hypothetical protein